MRQRWAVRARWPFLAATLLGLFSTAQAYRLTSLNPRARMDGIELGSLLVLNLALWYIPAAFTGTIFYLASRFRLDSERWIRALAVHSIAALAFSVVHSAAMLAIRASLWPEVRKLPAVAWSSYAQANYLRNLDWTLMTYAAVAGLGYAIGYYREAQARALTAARLETSLMEARLKTLEAELHPHFLFNTLHAISTLVHSDPEAADRMISRLSDLLRLTFDRSGTPAIPLKEELEFLQKYLEIEQIRFRDRLSVRFEIDPDTLDAEVPRMFLQPLVENAIKHGIAPKSGAGLVQVSSERRGGSIWIEVRDTGVGLSSSARASLSSNVGLSNTRERLECLYGEGHRLEFTEAQGGLAVQVVIPHRQSAAPAASAPARVVLA
jgi:signal transduction histidine kinase